jgi:hypothetical protein
MLATIHPTRKEFDMKGHQFVITGDPAAARDAVYQSLRDQGFTVTPNGDWAALAERGSKGASLVLGAFAGKSGRHVKLDITSAQDGAGNLVVSLLQGTSGISGGLIGKSQADQIYRDVYNTIGSSFQQSGALVGGGDL